MEVKGRKEKEIKGKETGDISTKDRKKRQSGRKRKVHKRNTTITWSL